MQLVARTRETEVACPDCAALSDRVHSQYGRCLADTPVGDRPVLIKLTARRLYCENARCSRRTFAEQVEGLTARSSRRTPAALRVPGGCCHRSRGSGREPSCRCSAYTGEPNDTAAGGDGLTRSRLGRSKSAGRR
ncbi:transposase family protein [Streptomyces sp. NPDC005356]|uniref:transposase family protein n=1 Tax=Streptomyces sp. NPDC005356 TaxID=3157167 RepID=UPI0033BEFB56